MAQKNKSDPNDKQCNTKNQKYVKLSALGKFIWIGLFITGWASFVNPLFLVVFVPLMIGAFSSLVYCEYKPSTDNENSIYSVSVTGRLGRSGYLGVVLCWCICFIVFSYMYQHTTGAFASSGMIGALALVTISLMTAAIRRAQDCGWNSWVPLIPGVKVLLLFIPSEKRNNRYGAYIQHQKMSKNLKSKKYTKKTKVLKWFIIGALVVGLVLLSFWLPVAYEQRKAYSAYRAGAIAGFKEQNIDVKDVKLLSRKEMNTVFKSSNKYYISHNENKIMEATKVWSYILSLDDIVDFCNVYYPTKQLQVEYNKTFFQTRKKAEQILVNAYGEEGFKLLVVRTFIRNQHLRFKMIEKDYQAMKQEAGKEGITDFTRKQYCQISEKMAEELALDAKKQFQTLFPNFYVIRGKK